jgi:hypothetical protein
VVSYVLSARLTPPPSGDRAGAQAGPPPTQQGQVR